MKKDTDMLKPKEHLPTTPDEFINLMRTLESKTIEYWKAPSDKDKGAMNAMGVAERALFRAFFHRYPTPEERDRLNA